MAVLNLKTARDKCPSQIRDPSKTNVKIGDMVLIRSHTPKDTSVSKYQHSFIICKKFSARLLMYKTVLESSAKCQFNICNFYTKQNMC